jgi:hypothetical protein
MRSTITGMTMLLINAFPIAIGNQVILGARLHTLAPRGPRVAAGPADVVAH